MINSGTRLIPDGFCFLDPLEELSIKKIKIKKLYLTSLI